jgi:tRNA-dihydrouridine synthase
LDNSFEKVKNQLVLPELAGLADGPYAIKNGRGAALVMLGTYIISSEENVPYPKHFVFYPSSRIYRSYLKKHIALAGSAGSLVGVSAIGLNIDETVQFLQVSQEEGADFASLCVHSSMDMFNTAGLGRHMCHKENLSLLKSWTSALVENLDIPLIMKIYFENPKMTLPAIEVMTEEGAHAIHINIGSSGKDSQGLAYLSQVKERTSFLIAGGGIKTKEDVQRIFDAGAHSAAIGAEAMKDFNAIYTITSALSNRY